MDYQTTIKSFIIENFLPDTAPSDLESGFDLLGNGIVDSLGLLTLVGWVEERFGIAVEDDDLSPDTFRSVDAIERYVERSSMVQAKG